MGESREELGMRGGEQDAQTQELGMGLAQEGMRAVAGHDKQGRARTWHEHTPHVSELTAGAARRSRRAGA